MFIFSHGFGVKKDNWGMFDEIAKVLPGESIQFDYNKIDISGKILTVPTISDMTSNLNSQIQNANEPVHVIGHSLGCLVVAVADLPHIDSALLLSPANLQSANSFAGLISSWPGAIISRTKDSTIDYANGDRVVIPASAWADIDTLPPTEQAYIELSKSTKLTVVEAVPDDVIGPLNFPELEKVVPITKILNSNHSFSGESRQQLLSLVGVWSRGKH